MANHSAFLHLPSRASSETSRQRLILFVTCPRPGRSKPRLIQVLGADGAAELHCEMIRRALDQIRRFRRRRPLDVEVRFDGGDAETMRRLFGEEHRYDPQGPGTIDQRLHRAIESGLRRGASGVVVVDSDYPAAVELALSQGLDLLQSSDLVAGPADDGGCCLVGVRRPNAELYESVRLNEPADIEWDTAASRLCEDINRRVWRLFEGLHWHGRDVIQRLLHRAEHLHMAVESLPMTPAVSSPESLALWGCASSDSRHACEGGEAVRARAGAMSISIITTARNGPVSLEAALGSTLGHGFIERIVVSDLRVRFVDDIAARHQARVLAYPSSSRRSFRLNDAAAQARGELLVFLPSGGLLPVGFDGAARRMLEPRVAAGTMAIPLHPSDPHQTAWPSRPALFVRADAFRSCGGYPSVPIMERLGLLRRLRRLGRVVEIDGIA